MDEKQNAFQIDLADNVATALTPLVPGPVELRGDACAPEVEDSIVMKREYPKSNTAEIRKIIEEYERKMNL